MAPVTVTPEQILKTLRDVVTESPDHLYESSGEEGECYYVHGETPGCLMGHVFHRLGVSLDHMREFELTGASSAAAGLLDVTDPNDTADDVLPALDVVQYAQDNGETWGTAYAHAFPNAEPIGASE